MARLATISPPDLRCQRLEYKDEDEFRTKVGCRYVIIVECTLTVKHLAFLYLYGAEALLYFPWIGDIIDLHITREHLFPAMITSTTLVGLGSTKIPTVYCKVDV